MKEMYKGVVNSPETTITNNISNTDTIIYVLDDTRIPDELPNLMVLGTGVSAETIRVLERDNNMLTVERGFQGAAKAWPSGTIIARNFTEYDYDSLRQNVVKLNNDITDLDNNKVDNDRVKTDVPEDAVFTDTITDIVDNLTANDAKKALSAKQGKILKDDLAAHKAEKVQHLSYATASGTNAYTATINGINSLVEGMSVKIKFTNANTGASTLNINGLGAKAIQKANSSGLSAGNIRAGQICHLVYTGSVFQLLGEGGEYGTAQAQDVLEGKTIGTEEGLVTGTMPNRGAINRTLTTQGGQIIVPKGYHDGSGIVKAQFANLVPENIKDGVNAGGVLGTYKPTYKPSIQTVSTDSLGWEVDGYRAKTFTLTPNNYVHSIIICSEYDDYTVVTSLPRDLDIQVNSYDCFLTRIERSGNDLIFTVRNNDNYYRYVFITLFLVS